MEWQEITEKSISLKSIFSVAIDGILQMQLLNVTKDLFIIFLKRQYKMY